MKTHIVAAYLFGLFQVSVVAAPFVNLDFESANTNTSLIEGGPGPFSPPFPGSPWVYGTGSAADLLPGWTVMVNGQATKEVAICNGYYGSQNAFSMPAHVALGFAGSYVSYIGGPLEGRYSVRMDNSRSGGFLLLSLTQTGDVPINAKLLLVHARWDLFSPYIQINDEYFGPQDARRLPFNMGIYGVGPHAAYYIDVSKWAGQTVTLTIAYADEMLAVVDGLEFVDSTPLQIDLKVSQLQGTNFILNWVGELATKYQVEASTNTPSTWFPVGSPVSSTNRVFTLTDTNATITPTSQRYYRLRVVP